MNPRSDLASARDEPVVSIRVKGTEVNKPDLILTESIDQTLGDLLGSRAKEAVYDHLERRCYMARDEIPRRIVEFCGVLETNFGKGGRTIERMIAKRFYGKLDKAFVEQPGYTLADYVESVTRVSNHSMNIPITTTTVTTYVGCDSTRL